MTLHGKYLPVKKRLDLAAVGRLPYIVHSIELQQIYILASIDVGMLVPKHCRNVWELALLLDSTNSVLGSTQHMHCGVVIECQGAGLHRTTRADTADTQAPGDKIL